MSVVLRKPPDRDLWRSAHAGEDVHEMDGVAFEDLISVALRNFGYAVEMTERYDRGADIVATRSGIRTSIQAKRSSWSVSEHAVDQAVRGMAAYGCTVAMVITNSIFTPEARRQADAQGVVLWDHEDLANLLHTTGIAPRTSTRALQCSTCREEMRYAGRPRPSWRCDGCGHSVPYRRWVLRVTAPAHDAVALSDVPEDPPSSSPRVSAHARRRGWVTELKLGVALAAVVLGWMCVVAAGLAVVGNQASTHPTQRVAPFALLVALIGIPTVAGTRSLRRARRRLRGVRRAQPATR